MSLLGKLRKGGPDEVSARQAGVRAKAVPKVSAVAVSHCPLYATVRRRRVTLDMCKALLNQRNLTDEQAQVKLDHLYCFASVIADAFVEQQKIISTLEVPSVQFSSESPLSTVRVV